jgi:hypothetical protein
LEEAKQEVFHFLTINNDCPNGVCAKAFNLKISMKEVQPKIDRLRDYEKKIEQLTKLQQLW